MKLLSPYALALLTFALLADAAGAPVSGPAGDRPGQLNSPIETIPLRQEADRAVALRGQRATGGCLVLTPDTCFFHGRLHLAGETAAGYPGAELNGNKSWSSIEGLDAPGKRVVWPLWLPGPATLTLSVLMDVPPEAAGATLDCSIGGAHQTVTTHASDGSRPQPWTVVLPVTKAGLYELSVALDQLGRAKSAGSLRRITVTGPGVDAAVLVRSRWRAAAVHAHFSSSAVAPADSRLWVMEVRPLPCEDAMYAPLTTPFGYFGATYEPDGTSGGINFSLWSYGRDEPEPPVAQLSHLLAVGDPRLQFSRFDGEGHGVKPRGWSPLDGCKISSAVFALRLDPGTPYDTYTGYVLDPRTREWQFFAAGRHWHADTRRAARGLLPGAFVEVPGPPDKERSAIISRGADFRGWCRDLHGAWHPIDQMTAGDIRADTLEQKTCGLLPDGWFRMAMGGLEQYQYRQSQPVFRQAQPQPLPDYLQPDRLAALDRLPASVTVDDVQRSGDTVTLHLQIQAPTPDTTVTVYYGPTDQLTFAERWPHHIQLGGPTAGKLTVPIPAGSGPGAGRVLVQGKFGSVWSDTSAGWQ